MTPKKSEWNSVIIPGDGICHNCHGKGHTSHSRGTHACLSCERTGVCHMCHGNGVRFGYNCGHCDNNYEKAEEKFYEAVGKHTPLREVLDAISDKAIADMIEGESDALREAFPLSDVTVSSGEEYDDLLSSYNEWMRSGSSYWLCMSYTRDGTDGCMSFMRDTLSEVYGGAAYMAAKSGEAGGMKTQLDIINNAFKKRWAKLHRETTLNYFKWEAKERLLSQYIEDYGDLPRKWQGRRPPLLTWDFAEILIHHATVIEPALRAEAERA